MLFVCYSRCTTCAKARKWLSDHHLEFTERDIKGDNPTVVELREWHAKSGLPIKRLFNTSGMPYRELGIKEKLVTMSDEDCYELLSTNGMLVKRPILVDGSTVFFGFKEAEWEAALL
jgi:arsenate reductase